MQAAGIEQAEDQLPDVFWMSSEAVAKAAVDAAEKGKRAIVPGLLNRAGRAHRPAHAAHARPAARQAALEEAGALATRYGDRGRRPPSLGLASPGHRHELAAPAEQGG